MLQWTGSFTDILKVVVVIGAIFILLYGLGFFNNKGGKGGNNNGGGSNNSSNNTPQS